MNLVLIGYRGSGKSTVGRLLAGRLGRPFVDLDDRIVATAGKSIRHLFERHGEPHFRRLESECLADVMAGDDQVIAVGGGAMAEAANHRLVAGYGVVYLHADAGTLYQRITGDPATPTSRPALTALPGVEEVKHLLARREPMYRSVATAVVDVSGRTPAQVVDAIVAMLESGARCENDRRPL